MIRHVKELSTDQRVVIESILGRALDDAETLSIRPVPVIRDAPPLDRRREIAGELRDYFARIDGQQRDASPEELDDAIDEALRHVRPSYKPIR
jgi:hypothetical protein